VHFENLVAFIFASLTLLTFGLSMRWFRDRKEVTPAKTRLVLSAYVCATVQLLAVAFAPRPPAVCLGVGVGLYLLAQGVFWWARTAHGGQRPAFAGTTGRPTFLTQTGPYRFIRHPIYTAYLLAWLAGAIVSAQPWLLIPAGWMALLHYLAARQEEGHFAETPFAQDYEAYRRRTGMFFPSVRGLLRKR
jgi:protein-S-isoprenylcysteine O-methyltransferase Ste14